MTRHDRLRERYEIVMAYRRLFLDDQGAISQDARTFFADMKRACEIDAAGALTDDAGRLDPAKHVFRDGKRSVFNYLDKRLSQDPVAIQSEMRSVNE